MPTVPHFPERLRYHRLRMKLSQTDLGEKIGVSQNAISTWERGESTPQIPELLALRDLFGVALEYLTGRSDSMAGLSPDQWIVNEDAVERRRVDRKNREIVAVKVPRRARIVDHDEWEQLRRELGLRIE